jgi:hypothetical protein
VNDYGGEESELDKVLGNAMRRPLAETIAQLDKELTSRWPTVENLVVTVHDLDLAVGRMVETLERNATTEDQRQQHSDKVLSNVASWIATADSSLRDLQMARQEQDTSLRELRLLREAQEEAAAGLLIRTDQQTDRLRRLIIVLSCVVTVQLAACIAVVAVLLLR